MGWIATFRHSIKIVYKFASFLTNVLLWEDIFVYVSALTFSSI